ncbi:MAG: tryptophan--tRNA ligase [Candidatus Yonathbacteria bacterium CG_4_10_14_3_um_filter_47_65]|nr:MAG: tryptophan--tRNA ligase [Candidatus Yonathbacteria bacterium CG23_combo_of_CG06-09_8_20_14_all_46_18]PIX56381.1 MAG: tryptophan--tRNA ligase [Candidatus Yonathbacteria bacterium CG_4_10_14_3_um_filter_47_65]PJC20241.1 MAG: tryptophan--tRNA ligase [Candidatus Yonathbacteria bacterium CG_4_9_14_0_2_um_filter_47_74]PJC66862.1 MAG: tryptophan--tRNA ligase [Candidatus Yonathbacteria bacterium CG_4_8_14_3_um_filter_46_25]
MEKIPLLRYIWRICRHETSCADTCIMTIHKTTEKQNVIITGVRPSANLTVANFVGSVIPLLDLQNEGRPISAFVATMHGLTDREPSEIVPNVIEVVRDYLALGLDPKKVIMFDQRAVRKEVALLKLYLERHITIARLLRVPALKDKLREGQTAEQASALLAEYPIMMAADILLQDANLVPVGKDQYAHIEATKELARAFNARYGDTLVVPEVLERNEPVNILALRGDGKMSKSKPDDAIFLTDNEETLRKKIKRAETADPGKKSEKIESLAFLGRILSPARASDIDAILTRHRAGNKVMADFKEILADIVVTFTTDFQKKRADVSTSSVQNILVDGNEIALTQAKTVLDRAEHAMRII